LTPDTAHSLVADLQPAGNLGVVESLREQIGRLESPLLQPIEVTLHTLRETHADWTLEGKERFRYIMRESII
jgi:hypothetical protein